MRWGRTIWRGSPLSAWALFVSGAGLLVLLYVMIGLTLWQDWASKPVEQLPALFWVLYTMIVVCWISAAILSLDTAKMTTTSSKRRPSIFRILILLVGVLVFLPPASFKFEWKEADFLYITAGLLLLLQVGLSLIQRLLPKARQ
jgi:hypothetical protein